MNSRSRLENKKQDEYNHHVPNKNHRFNARNRNDNYSNNYQKFGPRQYFSNRNTNDKFDEKKELNSIINDYDTKKQIIDYIYRKIELSNFKYKLIEFEYDLPLLKEKTHFVSPNYNGIHSLLIFVKLKDKYLSFIIDRKTLTYNQAQIDIEKVKIIPVYIRLDESVYQGTIIDGVLLYNNINGVKNFVVNDIYIFRGQDMINEKMNNKMMNITAYLESMKDDPATNSIYLIVNKLYYLSEIQQLVNLYIPKSKYSNSIKGVAFYPEISGTKLIYLYNNCSHDVPNEPENVYISKNQEAKHVKSVKSARESNVEVIGDVITAVFRLKRTDVIDVYNLYLGQKSIEGDKKLLKYKKICIAYIPTKECSFFCKDLFNQSKENAVLVECKYDSEKGKWIPIKQIMDRKRPDLYEKIEKLIHLDQASSE
jgi:hypothetical protein